MISATEHMPMYHTSTCTVYISCVNQVMLTLEAGVHILTLPAISVLPSCIQVFQFVFHCSFHLCHHHIGICKGKGHLQSCSAGGECLGVHTVVCCFC